MFKNKLASFMVKRVFICFILLSVIDMVLLEFRWHVLAGLILGSFFGVLKFGGYAWIFEKIVSTIVNPAQKTSSAKIGLFGFLVNQLLVFPLLLAAYFLNKWFFAGIVTGVLLVPFVIMLNSMTEALKITRNNFE
ncbi:MAG: hypothetical protein FIA99_14135 [Ruminiclostridium sp.]|nr:hypothetical protein [Ruminiclostridium sp.]